MKIVIIGSRGFIGSYIHQYFQNQGNYVVGCDVVTDYVNTNYFQIDATNSDFYQLFNKFDFDICINCSGAASVPDSLTNPIKDFYLNTVNVYKILEAIKIYRPLCKFINISSAAVYGNPVVLPTKETDTLNPMSPYGIHKLMAENICKEFSEFYKINTCSIRVFSAYGEGLKKQIFWDLHKKFENPFNIDLFGTGNETRDFIHIADVANAIQAVVDHANFKGEAINIANGNEISIKEAVELFADIYQWKGNISFSGNQRKGDPTRWKADISVLESFGYLQRISLKNGLTRYIKWIKGNN